jgi:N-acetylmuramic acid 6-phosphate (MurNAc-6-P) etherase
MAKRKKQEHDFSVRAFKVVQEATGQTEPETEQTLPEKERKFDPVALGHLGGLKGGKARAQKLTPEQRKEIARKAAQARWTRRGQG